MIEEFKKFIFKGNVVDLSTGVLIGAAFGGIVTAFTKGIVEPLLKVVGGTPTVSLGIKLRDLPDAAGNPVPVMLDIGMVINAIIGFLITAAIIFFVIVKPMNKLISLAQKKQAETPAPVPADVQLLTEIRDLLKK
jgi:large conductance mechanosensitive channel